jgi:hypothetical protein
MGRPMRGAVAALLAVVTALSISAPATAKRSGAQTFKGVIVASGASGTRKAVRSAVLAKGALRGIGHVVEVANQPGDPDNVSRDDLVFAAGTIHLRNVTVDTSMSLDSKTCIYSVRLKQTGTVVGGTKLFAAATGSYAGTVAAWGLARRTSAGACTLDQDPLYEVDTFVTSGSLSL